MIKFYVPEVEAVEEWIDKELQEVSNQELKKLEEKLAKEKV